MAHFQLPKVATDDGLWGPPTGKEATLALPEDFQQIPFSPFLKGDRIGRIADWNTAGGTNEDRNAANTVTTRSLRNARNGTSSNYASGAPVNTFAYFHAEDESSFSVVDNSRSATARRGAASGAARGGRGAAQAGVRSAGFTRGNVQTSSPSGRGGRGGGRLAPAAAMQRGARRGGYRDWERTQRKAREASITVTPDWEKLSEMDFVRLHKLRLDVEAPEDLASYGFLQPYDRSYDRVSVRFERPLQPRDRVHYSPTTSDDPVIQQIAEEPNDKAQVFITDSILAVLMCAPRSVYPWDIVITKTEDGKMFFDKRANGPFDFVTVNENASEPPIELNDPANGPNPERNARARINTPSALSLEATFVNENFGFQVCDETKKPYKFGNPNPFHRSSDEGQLASCAYRYRRFNLSTNEEDPVELVVRTELNAMIPGASSKAPPSQLITIRTLNEFDSRAPGAGGAPDWRSRLDQSRGAVVATEMKNNSFKLARFTVQSILAGADNMKVGFISRANPLDPYRHVIMGTSWFKPKELATQMAYSLANGWGIVRTIVDLVRDAAPGKFVLVKDPNRPIIQFFRVPNDFDQTGDEEEEEEIDITKTEPKDAQQA
ncbi:hypothetical protein MYAM1_002543 [Malassezia yamatoensis]|uniref:Eukaryotic translation initiation factor 3 subunit D n=1 Tax=Malassezia yamatoensis TaxID=253288 RepID=A0AAJ5YSC5_9BASI|nr:hypothetical protein MYAM1_002543 [Malassezia yamatoensis]